LPPALPSVEVLICAPISYPEFLCILTTQQRLAENVSITLSPSFPVIPILKSGLSWYQIRRDRDRLAGMSCEDFRSINLISHSADSLSLGNTQICCSKQSSSMSLTIRILEILMRCCSRPHSAFPPPCSGAAWVTEVPLEGSTPCIKSADHVRFSFH